MVLIQFIDFTSNFLSISENCVSCKTHILYAYTIILLLKMFLKYTDFYIENI